MNSVMRIFCFALLSCLLLQVARSADDDLTAGQARITDFIKTIRFSKARLFVYSLDPNDRKIYSATLPENSDQVFHRYPILGKIEIVPKLEKEYLLKTFAKGVKQGDTNSMPRCFEPRLGLRIVTELTTNDLVACYTCTLVKA